MKEGWDYSSWNKDGKNIFYFLDTCHNDIEIQEKIVAEGVSLFDRVNFPILFVEGYAKQYSVNFKNSVEDWKNLCIKKEGYWNANVLMSYYIGEKDPSAYFLGVEKKELLEKQYLKVKEFSVYLDKFKDVDVDEKNYDIVKNLRDEVLEISVERSDFAVRSIEMIMNLNNFYFAGLIFGSAHFEKISEGLLSRGIGVASYNPGESNKNNFEENLKYGLSF